MNISMTLLRNVSFLMISGVAFFISLALWAYHDAQERTDNPKIWTLIVLFAPSFLGLIIYLLVGRDKYRFSSGRFQKAAVTAAVCVGLSLVMVVGSAFALVGADGEELALELPFVSGSLLSMENNLTTSWSWSFKTSNQQKSRAVNLSASELAAFHVNSSSSSGTILLRVIQGDVVVDLDISGVYNGNVDLSELNPGRMTLILMAQQARNGNIMITWR